MKNIDSRKFLVDPDRVLETGIGQLEMVVVIGITSKSDIYVASSHGAPITNYLIDVGKKTILEMQSDNHEMAN